MFSTANDASKIALVYLVAQLRAGGFTLLDTQFKTDHLAQFGVIEIARAEYRRRLDEALPIQAVFGRIVLGQPLSLEDVIHYAGR
jgi:leucyl/phenylalanyl-tRNA--protein transferase